MRNFLITMLGIAGLIAPGAALAQHIYADAPTVYAFAGTGSARAKVQNDTVVEFFQTPDSPAAFGPLSPTRASVAASTLGSFAGFALGGAVSASADLSTGFLKASVSQFGPNFFGFPFGFASASLEERLLFNNTSGGDLAITFRYSFDGLLSDPNGDGNPEALMTLRTACPSGVRCFNADGVAIRFAGSGDTAQDLINAYVDENGIRLFARNIFGDQFELFDDFDVWQSAPYGSGGFIDGYMQTNLLIPAGYTELAVYGSLLLDCRGGSNCDFGNTGTFDFVGGIPDGLTIGSASGVFLTGRDVVGVSAPAATPLLAGVLGLAFALRRRRA